MTRHASVAPEVLMLSLLYWPEPTGSGPPVQHLAETLAAQGYRVRVVTARPSYPEQAVFPAYRDGRRDRECHRGVEIVRFPIPPQRAGGALWSRLWTELSFAARCAGWLLGTRPRPAAALAVCPSILAVATLVLLPRRIRRIAVVHDLQSGLAQALGLTRWRLPAWALERVERMALNRMDRVVTLSEAMAAAARTLGVRTPIMIVPPTVDDTLIQPLPEAPGPVTLLYSGNLGRKQGLEQLVTLAAALRQRGLGYPVIVRGDGNRRAALLELARARGVDNLRFEPLCPVAELSAALAAGHLHLVPQDPAGAAFAVPSKLYTSMAAGRPCIATAMPGSPLDRLRADSDAFVVCPPGEPEALVAAVVHLAADAAERARLGRNGRAYVERHAGQAAAAAAYRALLAGVET